MPLGRHRVGGGYAGFRGSGSWGGGSRGGVIKKRNDEVRASVEGKVLKGKGKEEGVVVAPDVKEMVTAETPPALGDSGDETE